jgi:hypothetical protein
MVGQARCMHRPVKRGWALFAGTLMGLLSAPCVAAITYTFPEVTYSYRSGIYINATGVTGSFTTASPLPPFLGAASNGPAPIAGGTDGPGYVTSWSFSDGVFTYTNLNSALLQNAGSSFAVTTDGSGNVLSYQIALTIPSSGATIGQPAEMLNISPTEPTGGFRSTCTVVQDGSCAFFEIPDRDYASYLPPGTPGAPAFVAAAPVPTLSEIGFILLGLLIAAIAFLRFRDLRVPRA